MVPYTTTTTTTHRPCLLLSSQAGAEVMALSVTFFAGNETPGGLYFITGEQPDRFFNVFKARTLLTHIPRGAAEMQLHRFAHQTNNSLNALTITFNSSCSRFPSLSLSLYLSPITTTG